MRKNLKRHKSDYRGVSLRESHDFPLLFDTIEFVYSNSKPYHFFDECDWLNHRIRLILYQNWKYSQPTDDLGGNGKNIPK